MLRGSLTRTIVAQHGDGLLIHWLYENTEVLSRRDSSDGHVEFGCACPGSGSGNWTGIGGARRIEAEFAPSLAGVTGQAGFA